MGEEKQMYKKLKHEIVYPEDRNLQNPFQNQKKYRENNQMHIIA